MGERTWCARAAALRVGIGVCLALGVGGVLPPGASGQSRADSAAVLLEAARRFESQRQGEVAAALYEMILARYGDTRAADAVRAARTSGELTALDRRGRTELYVWSTTYGATLGVLIPIALDADDPEAFGAGLLLGAPAGFLTARAYLRDRTITEGQARAITWGGTWGTAQGLGWVKALDLGISSATGSCIPSNPPVPCYDTFEEDDTRETITGMIVGGLAGVATGAFLARKPITEGTATTVSLASLWGAGYGASLGYLAGIEDDGLIATTLLAGNAALVGSAFGQRSWDLSRSRARLISVAGLAGALAGGGIDLLVQPESEKTAVLIPVVTGTAGLIFGIMRTADMDPDQSGDRPDDGGDLGALIHMRNGSLGLGTPRVRPHIAMRAGNSSVSGVYVPVFSTRF